jgi:membrane protein DedA with SNARE-associated domain
VSALLTVGLALALRLHHFHGPPIDYAGLAAAAAASWIGVPGPGEPILIAAGVFAAKHKLDIGSVLFVAWIGATAGGVGGWLIGMKAGRRIVTAQGPLLGMRLRALDRGEEIFRRYALVAILLAPTWVAGIHHVRPQLFLPLNALASAIWAGGIGLGAYFIGPAVLDFVDDLGLVTALVLAALILAAVCSEVLRRRRRRGNAAANH